MTRRMFLSNHRSMLELLALLALSLATASAGENTNNNKSSSGVISIPLIPHHVLQERRRLDGSLSEQQLSELPKQERPTHSKYHYERLLQQQQQLQNDNDENGRQLADAAFKAQQIASLFQGYGTHYADLWCGSPTPQRQTVIVDTGSGVTAFPCVGCADCGVPDYHLDLLFDGTQSSTYRELTCSECLRGSCSHDQCTIGMSYQEGSSWTAHEVADLCYVGGVHDKPVEVDDGRSRDADPFHAPAFAFDMKFGCQTALTGLFKTQLADGIMGMDVASAAFWYQMHAAGKIDKKAFSLCFSRKDEAARSGTEAGAMSLGGTDTRLHLNPMVFSATQESSGFYVVHVRKVHLRAGGGGTSALSTSAKLQVIQLDISEESLNSGRVIVDSGTTDTYFSRKLGEKFSPIYKQLTGMDYDHGVKKFTPEQLAMQPTILFQLSGDETLNLAVQQDNSDMQVAGLAGDLDPEHPHDVILAIPPEHYFEYDPDVEGYVSRFYVDEGSGGVLGANAMMGHDVYFDVDSYRIGWAESKCDYPALVAEDSGGDAGVPPPPPPSVDEPLPADEPAPAPVDEEDVEDDDVVEDEEDYEPTEDDGDEEFEGGDDEPGHQTEDEDASILETDDYTPPDDPYDEPGFCSGFGCQISALALVLFAVLFAAVRLVRRAPKGPAYDLATSELELQVTNGNGSFVNGGYHDRGSREFA